MPQNISVVIIDSNAESLNNYCQVRRQKIVIASEKRDGSILEEDGEG